MATKTWTGGAADSNWATAGNWNPSGAPASGDIAIFDGNAATGVNGSDQSAVTLADLYIYNTFGSASPGTILFGSAATALKIGVTAQVRIGETGSSTQPGPGSQRINVDLAATTPAATVVGTNPSSIDVSKETCRIKGSGSPKVTVFGGYVGIATDNATDTATLGAVVVGGGTLNLGAGCTLGSVTNDGGTITIRSVPTSLVSITGELTTSGTYDIATVTLYGGIAHLTHRAAAGNSIDALTSYGGAAWDTGLGGTGMQIGSLIQYP